MDEELRTAIDELNRLFKERTDAGWWSQNIIDASRNITSKENWTKFYAYMHNPESFDPNKTYMTIEECTEDADLSYPDSLEEIRYENGPDTIIHIKVKDDEKIN
jgi:hypothetical protein